MSQSDLAKAAGVEPALVIRAEMAVDVPQIVRRDATAIQRALERAGIEFVLEHGRPGVQLREAPS